MNFYNLKLFFLFRFSLLSFIFSDSSLLEEELLIVNMFLYELLWLSLSSDISLSRFSISKFIDSSDSLESPNFFLFSFFFSFGCFSISFWKYSFCSLYKVINVSIYIEFSISPFWLNSFLKTLLKFSKEFVVLNFILIFSRHNVLFLKYSTYWLIK